MLNALPRMASDPADYTGRAGVAAIADGEAEVLRRTHGQLMKGLRRSRSWPVAA